LNEALNTKFDGIIVGAGVAGLSAAITAFENGANVVLLEKASRDWILNPNTIGQKGPGGNQTGRSGGVFIFTPYLSVMPQLTEKPKDSNEILSVIRERSENNIDLELTKYHIEHYAQDIEWLESLGAPFVNRQNIITSIDADLWEGKPVMVPTQGMGVQLINFLVKTVEEKGIKILWEHTALKLLTDDKGEVVGLRAKNSEGLVDFEGKVVLATGGFEGNVEMLEKYVRNVFPYILPIYDRHEDNPTGVVRTGSLFNTGDGHRMAMEVRAKLVNMYMARCRASDVLGGFGFTRRKTVQAGIVVNLYGQRVADETASDNMNIVLPMQPKALNFVIFDETIRQKYPEEYESYPQKEKCFVVADTIEELAQKLNIDCAGLKETISEYNAALRDDGSTPDLPIPKSKYGMKIENPPFYGHTLRAGLNDTWGGIKINAKAQVIDLDGKPIPGLYACGGCTGGGMYFVPKEKRGTKTIEVVTGVGALAGALTFGRVVGQEIAGK